MTTVIVMYPIVVGLPPNVNAIFWDFWKFLFRCPERPSLVALGQPEGAPYLTRR